MKTRWAIATLGVIALATVTLSIQMPWLFKAQVAMVEAPLPLAQTADSGPATSLSCPADAKPANFDFTLKNHEGKDVSLSSFKGKVVLIDFWATWCGPCKVEIPHFIEFQDRYGKDGLQIVGISVDDTAEMVAPYIRDMKMNYPVLLGLDHDDVLEAYGPLVGIPVSVLLSRDGKICATHTGLTGKDVFEREIKALL
ncbi:MAG: TlpA disulfide reductase family protein [Vicinamibacterales bacterium]